MQKRLQAVYKDRVLQPLEPLDLQDMQQVTAIITESPAIDDDLFRYFTPEEWETARHDRVSWSDARLALSKISGSLSEAVIPQRQER